MHSGVSRRQILIGLVSGCTSGLIAWLRAARGEGPQRRSRRLPAAETDAGPRGPYVTYTSYDVEAETFRGGPITTITYDGGTALRTGIESSAEGGQARTQFPAATCAADDPPAGRARLTDDRG